MKFSLPIPPSNNTYKRHFCSGIINRNGEHVVKAALTPRAKRYKEEAQQIAKYEGRVRLAERGTELSVRVDLYETSEGQRAHTHVDLDNIPKVIFDALNGIAWEDDSQVAELRLIRHPDYQGEPHVDVEIIELKGGGRVQLDGFPQDEGGDEIDF